MRFPLVLALATSLGACSVQVGETSCAEIAERLVQTERSVDRLRSEVSELERIFPTIDCDERCNAEVRACLRGGNGADTSQCFVVASDASSQRMDVYLADLLGVQWRRPDFSDQQATIEWEARRAEVFRSFVTVKHGELSTALTEHAAALGEKLAALKIGTCRV